MGVLTMGVSMHGGSSSLLPHGAEANPGLVWDREREAECDASAVLKHIDGLVSETKCTSLCSQHEGEPACSAVTHNKKAHVQVGLGKCTLYQNCTLMAPVDGVTSLFKPQLEWPTRKEDVRWQADAALVIASYRRDLAFLRQVPKGRADIVVYQKDFQPPSFATKYTQNLRYFTHLPNFGKVGGSRETVVYLQFLLDFYDNLPQTIIFSQDEIGPWSRFLMPSFGNSSTVSLGQGFQGNRIEKENCMCTWEHETFYKPHRYYWFEPMNWYTTSVLQNDWCVPATQHSNSMRWRTLALLTASAHHIA